MEAALAKLFKTGMVKINCILSSKEGPTKELTNTMHFWLLAHHQLFYLIDSELNSAFKNYAHYDYKVEHLVMGK